MPRLGTRSFNQALLVVALVGVMLSGCGAAAGSSPSGSATLAAITVATPAASSSTAQGSASAGPNGEVGEDLTFSGAFSGHMTKAQRGDMYVCTGGNFVPSNPNTTGQLVVGPIVGDVGGKQVRLNITKINYHGPGTYDAGGVSFDVGSDHYFPVSAPSGTLTVSTGGRGGTVTMDLAVNSGTTTTVGHAQGSWKCPADAF